MRTKTIIATLRSWVQSLWPFARGSPPLHVIGLPPTPSGSAIPGPSQSQAESVGEVPSERGAHSNEQEENELPGDEPQPTCRNTACTEIPHDSDSPEQETAPPVSHEGGQPTAPKIGEESSNGETGSRSNSDTGITKPQKTEYEPHRIGGKRGPKLSNSGSKPQPSLPFRPELICQKIPGSACWEIILNADKEYRIAAVHLEDKPLEFVDQQYRIPSLSGSLNVRSEEGTEHVIPLFGGEPLIFKMKKNWSGKGRRVLRINSGHFVAIVPSEWERIGHVPIEPTACSDPAFQAHYFHRDTTASYEDTLCFREWNDTSTVTGIELVGESIFDDSDDGILFVGDPPELKYLQQIEWARVGEESEPGWGQNFRPKTQSLSKILDGREGRFFIRVYDPEVRMLDSMAFRYVRNLKRIEVNGTEYSQDTVLGPERTGYPPIDICLIGADGSILTPPGAIAIPPRPDADFISHNLESTACRVNVILDLPRIWWRLDDQSDSGEWRDTPLTMTREEFRNHTYEGAALSVLSKREAKVRAGFDDQLDRPYRRNIQEDRISIPLDHFADYIQIAQRLNRDPCFNVEWAQKIVPLILISADPEPEIVSFTAEPTTIVSGEETILEWVTRNAGDACVEIAPDTGAVEANGRCAICPAETTAYTLILNSFGSDDIRRAVTVTVVSPDQQPIPRIISAGGEWRAGKGFSLRELRDAGLTAKEAADRSIPIDKRRRTAHPINIRALGGVRDA